MKLIGIILLSVVMAAVGQVLLKKGMLSVGSIGFDLKGLVETAKAVVVNYQVLIGMATYILSALFWLMALSRAELSFVYPFTALTFVLVMIASVIIFRESVSFFRVVGFLLICCGILFVSRT